jgi:lipoprotein-anchoring transpeptidase ErfK/SrfK
MGIGVTAWSGNRSPVLARLLQPAAQAPTATEGVWWAEVEIAKPTYTALPTLTPPPTPTSTLEPTETPAVAWAEIVPDTPTAEGGGSDWQPAESGSAPAGGWNKYVLVDISQQHLYAYQDEALLYSFLASTGMNNATATGIFSVLSKIPKAYGATWNIWMPNWLGIYWAGGLQNGIHALPILSSGARLWDGFLGTPISYGCVVLGQYESQLLYDWVDIGTPVEIQW